MRSSDSPVSCSPPACNAQRSSRKESAQLHPAQAESERKHPISIRLDLDLDLPWAGSLEHVAEPFRTLGNQLQGIRAGVRRGSAERAEPDDRKLGDLAFKAFTGGLGVATLYLTVTFSINVYRGLAWHNAQSSRKHGGKLSRAVWKTVAILKHVGSANSLCCFPVSTTILIGWNLEEVCLPTYASDLHLPMSMPMYCPPTMKRGKARNACQIEIFPLMVPAPLLVLVSVRRGCTVVLSDSPYTLSSCSLEILSGDCARMKIYSATIMSFIKHGQVATGKLMLGDELYLLKSRAINQEKDCWLAFGVGGFTGGRRRDSWLSGKTHPMWMGGCNAKCLVICPFTWRPANEKIKIKSEFTRPSASNKEDKTNMRHCCNWWRLVMDCVVICIEQGSRPVSSRLGALRETFARCSFDSLYLRMADRDDDSDAPEEFTVDQLSGVYKIFDVIALFVLINPQLGIKQDEQIRRIQRESKTRVAREGKEQRRQWEERKTKRPPRVKSSVEDPERETHEKGQAKGGMLGTTVKGMLPIDIVNHLADHEKKTFHSDSEDEAVNHDKPVSKKKKQKTSREGLVLLGEIPAAECLNKSMEFLKKRKGHVSRSTTVLKNPNQALRLLSTTGRDMFVDGLFDTKISVRCVRALKLRMWEGVIRDALAASAWRQDLQCNPLATSAVATVV
ncbi:hypothetical protein ACLOJK_030923 [Asimina triloba]